MSYFESGIYCIVYYSVIRHSLNSHSIKTMTLKVSVYKESTLLYKSSEIARRAANQKMRMLHYSQVSL